jgi:hypothetical protein
MHNAIHAPFRLFFSESFFSFFFFKGSFFKSCSLLFRHLHFLNLWTLFSLDSLILNGVSLIFHFWNCEPHIQVHIKFLFNIIECQFDHNLSETSVFLCIFNSISIPNEIINLHRVTFLVIFFSDSSKTQWNSQPDI